MASRFLANIRIITTAMKHGIANAVTEYARHIIVNVKPCRFFINPKAVYLGTMPDLLVYDPNEVNTYIWCIRGDMSYAKLIQSCAIPYLKQVNNGFKLRESYAYYKQVMGQMALSGMEWADFSVSTENDMHINHIHFDSQT